MSVFNIISKFFGNKYEKDIKAIMPLVSETNKEFESIKELSNDDLRERTRQIKRTIKDYTSEEKKKIKELKERSESDIPTEEKSELYKEVDKLEDLIIEKNEEILNSAKKEAQELGSIFVTNVGKFRKFIKIKFIRMIRNLI